MTDATWEALPVRLRKSFREQTLLANAWPTWDSRSSKMARLTRRATIPRESAKVPPTQVTSMPLAALR
eukprot:8353679-Pyramimonas_sp.AAC.1